MEWQDTTMSVIDQSTEFGIRAARHLREESVVWMTTTSRSGAPLPSPVWFLWDQDEAVLIYSKMSARIRNLAANHHVSLNFAGDGNGGDIVILSGTAVEVPTAPTADHNQAYLAKYRDRILGNGWTPESFAEDYRVPVRVTLTGIRGH
jgi:PPOX class probable F420-dependent enzyme